MVFLTRQATVLLVTSSSESDSVAVSESESESYGVVISLFDVVVGAVGAVGAVVSQIARHMAMALVTGDLIPLFLTAPR